MTPEEKKTRLKAIQDEKEILLAERELRGAKENLNRSRAITVGTAFGGVTEVSMRGEGDKYLWCLLQPVEVTELIHQLAGNIGCHINLQPRNDFGSWREWRDTNPLLPFVNSNGHPPHPNDMAKYQNVGAVLPSPKDQPGLKITKKTRTENDEPLAVEKTINKRKSKRTPAVT